MTGTNGSGPPAACAICGEPTTYSAARIKALGGKVAVHQSCVPDAVAPEHLRPGTGTESEPERPAPAPMARRLPVEVVVDDERCDLAFEDKNAARAWDEWDSGDMERAKDRERARSQYSWGQRYEMALAALATGSTVSSRSGERAAKTTGDDERDPGPPPAVGPAVGPHVTVVQRHVRELEDMLDQERGLTRPGAGGLMIGEEKDRRIWELQGVRAEVVARDFPALGGSSRTIMRAREREAKRRGLKVRQVDGVVTGKVVKGAYDD